MISVLCVDEKSNYFKIPGLDLWTVTRDAYNFIGKNPVITHAPCQQWSRMKGLSKPNAKEKKLAYRCYDLVNENGGIFEHPKGSNFFTTVGADESKIFEIDQYHFGFDAIKRTVLYCHNVNLLPYHRKIYKPLHRGVSDMAYRERSIMPFSFCQYLVNSVADSFNLPPINSNVILF